MPSFSAGVVKLHVPPLPTVTVPSTVAPSETVMVLPAAAVPLNTGVASLVAAPEGIGTDVPLLSLLSCTPPGAGGAVVSMVKVNGVLAAPVLPAASVTVVVRLCEPSPSAGEVKLQLPSLPTVTEPNAVLPSDTVTTLPGSARPLNTGVTSLVVPPSATGTSVPLPSLLSCKSVAAAGGVVSTITITTDDAGPTLPAVSVTVVVRLCCPSLSGSVGVKLQLPSMPVIAVPSTVVPSLTVTVLPGSAVPFRVGVVSPVVLPEASGVPSSLVNCTLPAAAGGWVSMVTVTGVEAGPVLPAASVTVEVRL